MWRGLCVEDPHAVADASRRIVVLKVPHAIVRIWQLRLAIVANHAGIALTIINGHPGAPRAKASVAGIDHLIPCHVEFYRRLKIRVVIVRVRCCAAAATAAAAAIAAAAAGRYAAAIIATGYGQSIPCAAAGWYPTVIVVVPANSKGRALWRCPAVHTEAEQHHEAKRHRRLRPIFGRHHRRRAPTRRC